MKLTTDILRQLIKEELEGAMGAYIPGKEATLDFLKTELGNWQPSAIDNLRSKLEKGGRFDLTQDILDIIGRKGDHASATMADYKSDY